MVRHLNQRYAFVVSSQPDLRTGYGTAAALLGLMEALHRKGKQVGLVGPSPWPFPEAWRSWWFNVHVPRTLSNLDVDCVVGIDFDGYRYALRKGRRPFIAFIHGVKADERLWEEGWPGVFLQRAARLEGQAARAADLVAVPSSYAGRRACEAYGVDGSHVRVVPLGLHLEDWPVWPPADGPPRVATAGRLVRRKGLDDLIAIWPRVRERVPDAILDIAGDGPERSRLEKLANRGGLGGCVHFHGVQGRSELRALIRQAHVFCLPSRQEAFGLVLLEAMACGRPVVAMHTAALPELVGEAGLLVEPGSPEALTDALARALLEPSLGLSLARAGRARAENYSWEHAATRFGEVAALA